MIPKDRAPAAETHAAPNLDLVRQQRDANEKLVLATLRARDAQQSAEDLVEILERTAAEQRSVADFRERLIGIVGHDLRNPLNTMILASRLLLGHGTLGDADARLVTRIMDSGERMAGMITQMLEFTRANLCGFSLVRAPTDLATVCSDVADELRLSSSAEINVTVEGDVAGQWDAVRLAAVLSNLASNALDYAADGTAVVMAARDQDENVSVAITNRGRCIPPEVVPLLFQPFLRGPEAQRRAGHMGLGLYISSEIVRAHGGTLEVRSEDEITTFTMCLPRVTSAS